jgi:hypothetical protein
MDSQGKGTAIREYSLNDVMDLVKQMTRHPYLQRKEKENLIRTQKI